MALLLPDWLSCRARSSARASAKVAETGDARACCNGKLDRSVVDDEGDGDDSEFISSKLSIVLSTLKLFAWNTLWIVVLSMPSNIDAIITTSSRKDIFLHTGFAAYPGKIGTFGFRYNDVGVDYCGNMGKFQNSCDGLESWVLLIRIENLFLRDDTCSTIIII